ncbi:13467_t:CDS:2, partial [Gigaspora rosea]
AYSLPTIPLKLHCTYSQYLSTYPKTVLNRVQVPLALSSKSICRVDKKDRQKRKKEKNEERIQKKGVNKKEELTKEDQRRIKEKAKSKKGDEECKEGKGK